MTPKDLTLDEGSARPKVNIVTRDDAGEPTTHPFEVLPITKPRMDALRAMGKAALPLQKVILEKEAAGEMPTDEEMLESERATVETIDLQLRSRNGPVTVQSLWEDGLIPAHYLSVIAEHLQTLAVGDPPA